ncbi:MAG: malectin domain-containing carbohydrate-binding protein, partial [Luteolibacter sp.]
TMSFSLTTQAVNGTVTLSSPGGTYPSGSSVIATAASNPGYQFTGWSGAISGSVNPTSVLMDGDKSITANFAVAGPLPTEYRENSGGPTYLALDGSTYPSNTVANVYSTTQPISNTLDDTLYQSERWLSALNYSIPLANGNYQVTLMFAEIFPQNNAVGKRSFSVTLEGATVITNLDIFSKVGLNAAYHETHITTVSDGQLNIDFIKGVNNPKISAIRVIPAFVLSTTAVNGSVTLDPPTGVYSQGTQVTLTAAPQSGFQFAGWNGDLTGSEISTTIVMDGSKNVTANFNSTVDAFTGWAGSGVNFADDANHDGLKNGLAWLLGAANPNENGSNLLSASAQSSGALKLSFKMLPASAREGSQLFLEYSKDLGIGDPWTGILVYDTTGVSGPVTIEVRDVDPVNPNNPLDIDATISATEALAGRLFGRLRAVK